VWRAGDRQPLHTLRGRIDGVVALVLTPNGTLFSGGSIDDSSDSDDSYDYDNDDHDHASRLRRLFGRMGGGIVERW
jgi:hypothetical protein